MTSTELRQSFLAFFKAHGHTVVPSSSLLPDDPSVLLTTAGMQQFKKYYTNELDPMKDFGSCRVASAQKCFRTSDIEEVGDERHLTFFEMLGNFSFTSPFPSFPRRGLRGGSPLLSDGIGGGVESSRSGYFKNKAIALALEFLQTIGLKDQIDYVSVFGGDDPHVPSPLAGEGKGEGVPWDQESFEIWKSLGIPESKIRKEGRKDNFWGPTGKEGPCGPTTEIYVNGVEIWNLVFNEYYAYFDGRLEKVKTPGVDTGMGLERLAMVCQSAGTIFETDLFQPIIEILEKAAEKPYTQERRHYRVIVDHIRGACFLIVDGVLPSNLAQGYVLRRIIRRMVRSMRIIGFPTSGMQALLDMVIRLYGDTYSELKAKAADISTAIQHEVEKFSRALDRGLKEFERMAGNYSPPLEGGAMGGAFSGHDAFLLYESYGFPFEMTKEMLQERGLMVDEAGFQEEFKKHQSLSRLGVEKKFGGHGIALFTGELKAASQEEMQKVTRLHTATHLLQQALREVLGPEVSQRGSDITAERARFDFTFARKVSELEIQRISELVNQKIQEDLPVTMREMKFKDAVAGGALAFFKGKYPPIVKVYSIGHGEPVEPFSKEVCGGPHVGRTGEIGTFKIIKEEASSAGVRRIRVVVE